MRKAVKIENLNDISLDSHLLIEASAGTGKTYAIEHIVLNLLLNEKINSFDEILVVTFTEKATSELKERIRDRIIQSLQEHNSILIKNTLNFYKY